MPPRNIAVRLTCPYETLRTTIGDWGLVSKHLVVYEHPEPNNIHCHMLLTGVYVTTQNLKDTMWSHGVPCKGSGQLSFKETFKCPTTKKVIDINEESWPKYIAYMSKGKYEPKYTQGFSDETIQSYRALWVDYTQHKPAVQLYKEFERHIQSQTGRPGIMGLDFIKAVAHDFMFQKHQTHSQLMRREQSQLIDDYCYRNNISKKYKLPFQE